MEMTGSGKETPGASDGATCPGPAGPAGPGTRPETRIVRPATLPVRYACAAFLLIASACLLIYSNTLHSPFFFDDKLYILDNPGIRSLGNFLDFSGTRYVAFLSFAVNYAVGGYEPFGYHIVNVAVHVINGLLVWWLVLLTFGTPAVERAAADPRLKYFAALAAAVIFVSHPVQTQAVTYITQRFATLATLFYLLSLTLFIKWRLSPELKGRTVLYLLSLLSVVLAMKTKEISFTLPVMIVLYEVMFFDSFFSGHERRPRTRFLPLVPFLLTMAIIPLNIFGPELGIDEGGSGIAEEARRLDVMRLTTLSRHDYVITQVRVIATYVRLLFLPVNQNFDYDYPVYTSPFEPAVFLSFLFLFFLFTFAFYLFLRSRKTNNGYGLLASFGILWFFITLSVESGAVVLWNVIFEHRLYLPSVGVVLALSAGVFYVFDYLKPMNLMAAAVVLLLVTALPLSYASYRRNGVWKDSVTLWTDVVGKSPDKARGHNNLGRAYQLAGRSDD
ncbi:MAG: hypothetical protein V3W31_00895, partial [Thermodesulfobacteriota bacterium]